MVDETPNENKDIVLPRPDITNSNVDIVALADRISNEQTSKSKPTSSIKKVSIIEEPIIQSEPFTDRMANFFIKQANRIPSIGRKKQIKQEEFNNNISKEIPIRNEIPKDTKQTTITNGNEIKKPLTNEELDKNIQKSASKIESIEKAIQGTLEGKNRESPIDTKDYRRSDYLAFKGGFKVPYSIIQSEKNRIDESENEYARNKREYERQNMVYQSIIDEYNEKQNIIDLLNKNPNRTEKETERLANLTRELESERQDYNNANKWIRGEGVRKATELNKIKREIDDNRRVNTQNIINYQQAAMTAYEIEQKEESVRTKWLKPISENIEGLFKEPHIGSITDVVGFGKPTTEKGLTTFTGGVHVNPGANEWFKTRVGDRGLVESLVNIRSNRAVTPFGAPGTIVNSNISNQFDYSLPVRRIGVEDVRATPSYRILAEDIKKPGFRITPEDVKRKKSKKSLPKLQRKSKVSPISIKGNIELKPHNITASIPKQNNKKVNINITPYSLDMDIQGMTSVDLNSNINKFSVNIKKKKMVKL